MNLIRHNPLEESLRHYDHGDTLRLILFLCLANSLLASDSAIRERLLGAAYLDNQSYGLLEEMTDRFGGRITGSEANEQSMTFLQDALKKQGIKTRREPFTFQGWERRNDEAVLLEPINRKLRAIALGYVESQAPFAADVALIDKANKDEISANLKEKSVWFPLPFD